MGAFCSPFLRPFFPFFSDLPPFLLFLRFPRFPEEAKSSPLFPFFPDLEFPPTIPEEAVARTKVSPRTEYWTSN
jgi:hypothetical protein